MPWVWQGRVKRGLKPMKPLARIALCKWNAEAISNFRLYVFFG
jgi:hypothetical protein